jgi:hypothetical protein
MDNSLLVKKHTGSSGKILKSLTGPSTINLSKQLPYILTGLLAVAIIMLLVTGSKLEKRFDERITLRKRDKIPYGSFVAYNHLKYLFPAASISANRREPAYWDSLSRFTPGQALIVVSPYFNASEKEMEKLVEFVEAGNDLFISTRFIPEEVQEQLGLSVYSYNLSSYFSTEGESADSLHLGLSEKIFSLPLKYAYPGRKYNAYISAYDLSTTTILGFDDNDRPNFIRLRAGNGNLYLHLAPLAFSNYFLLHASNIQYYEKILSLIDPSVKTVVWDEYFMDQRPREGPSRQRENWLSVLFRYPSLRAALITALAALLVFVLLEMRRKQRYIPVMAKPRNESLDFVKTIGRLYFEKSDHKNLCRKMGAYFLEYVRNRYKLQTSLLDDEFVKALQHKSDAGEAEIRGIISFIRYADDAPLISHRELSDFHRQLEAFYKKA